MQCLGLLLVLYLGTVSPAVGPFLESSSAHALWPASSQAAQSSANRALFEEVTISGSPP